MNKGKTVFSQVMDMIPRREFDNIVSKYNGNRYAKQLSCHDQFLIMCMAQYYGMDKHVKEDSAAYLKSCLQSLKEDASFIKTVLLDVKRAAGMLTFKIDEVKSTIKPAEAA